MARLVKFGRPIEVLHAKNAAARRRIDQALAEGRKPNPRDFKSVPLQMLTHVSRPNRRKLVAV